MHFIYIRLHEQINRCRYLPKLMYTLYIQTIRKLFWFCLIKRSKWKQNIRRSNEAVFTQTVYIIIYGNMSCINKQWLCYSELIRFRIVSYFKICCWNSAENHRLVRVYTCYTVCFWWSVSVARLDVLKDAIHFSQISLLLCYGTNVFSYFSCISHGRQFSMVCAVSLLTCISCYPFSISKYILFF